ncbi:MAG: apolipoprotein N-acyltransferase [Pseudomonadota bacterium]
MTTLVAIFAGLLAIIGWPPLAFWPLTLLAYSMLMLISSRTLSFSIATLRGLTFGLGLHSVGNYWVFLALHYHAGLSSAASISSLFFFASYLALFTAIPCGLWNWIYLSQPIQTSWQKIYKSLSFAALLTLGEWSRTLFFNGYSMLSLGYALIDTWLSGYAPILGVYGLSFCGFFLAFLFSDYAYTHFTKAHTHTSMLNGFIQLLKSLKMPLLFWLTILGIGKLLSYTNWVKPHATSLSYTLIQANISQENKFNPLHLQQQLQTYTSLITQAPADIILTPETAFPIFFNEMPVNLLSQLQAFIQTHQSHIFLGIATLSSTSNGYNSLIHLSSQTSTLKEYNKIRLMPFGEYSPQGFSWFTQSLDIPLKDQDPGFADQSSFIISKSQQNYHIAPLICHEDSNGHALRKWLPEASILIAPSNLGWFQNTSFLDQNIQLLRFRALELGRPILRAANTGFSSHIDHHGTIIKQLPIHYRGTLRGEIYPTEGSTPYSYWGDYFILTITLLIIINKLLTKPT